MWLLIDFKCIWCTVCRGWTQIFICMFQRLCHTKIFLWKFYYFLLKNKYFNKLLNWKRGGFHFQWKISYGKMNIIILINFTSQPFSSKNFLLCNCVCFFFYQIMQIKWILIYNIIHFLLKCHSKVHLHHWKHSKIIMCTSTHES